MWGNVGAENVKSPGRLASTRGLGGISKGVSLFTLGFRPRCSDLSHGSPPMGYRRQLHHGIAAHVGGYDAVQA